MIEHTVMNKLILRTFLFPHQDIDVFDSRNLSHDEFDHRDKSPIFLKKVASLDREGNARKMRVGDLCNNAEETSQKNT